MQECQKHNLATHLQYYNVVDARCWLGDDHLAMIVLVLQLKLLAYAMSSGENKGAHEEKTAVWKRSVHAQCLRWLHALRID